MYSPDLSQLSSSAPHSAASNRPWKGAGVLDTVKVAADTFQSVMFMASAERKEFTRDNVPNRQKAQKVNAQGVPVWSVQVAAVDWRGNPQLVSVTVAAHDDPGSKFKSGDPVRLDGLVLGVTPKREGGYVVWCSADNLAPALAAVAAAS